MICALGMNSTLYSNNLKRYLVNYNDFDLLNSLTIKGMILCPFVFHFNLIIMNNSIQNVDVDAN